MPDIDEIERRLRLPAPDEPAFLPALVLPRGELGSGSVRGSIRAGRSGAAAGLFPPRLAMAILLLLALMVGAIMTGTVRLEQLLPLDPDAPFAARGVTLQVPKDWIRITPSDPDGDSSASTALVASSTGVEGCSAADLPPATPPAAVPSGTSVEVPVPDGPTYPGVEDQIFACVLDRPMAAGETRVALSMGLPQQFGIGPIEPFDATAWFGPDARFGSGSFYIPRQEDGWTEEIDGMPAKVVAVAATDPAGPDEIRTWAVYDPRRFDEVWFIRFSLRGSDLAGMRAQADRIAKSLRFDDRPPALVTDERDQVVAKAIDRIDRESREFSGSRIFGCFPRTPGERTVTLEDGPGGPLPEPVSVTCRTTVETTPLMNWHATLVVSWTAGDGYPTGQWGWELFVGSDPTTGAQGQLPGNESVAFPGTGGEPPPRLAGPLVIPVGAIVEVLPPGIDQARADGPIQALYQDPNATIGDRVVTDAQAGRRFAVINGPLTHGATDWYLVESMQGTSFPGEFAWLPATHDDRPLVKVVEPECPAQPSVEALLRLLPAERVRCFGDRELTLDPAFSERAEDFGGSSVDGSPSWLAKDSAWRLYGAGGPNGLEGPIAVAIAPTLGDALQTGVRLRVRGHFDDPASATCERTLPEGWGGMTETPEMQHLRCRQLFVVTEVEEVSVP